MSVSRMIAKLSIVSATAAGALLWSGPAAADVRVPTRAGQQYLEVLQPDGSYQPIYVKGVNLSVALPGYHPSEFPHDKALYAEWLRMISEMNCNAVRLYTILPPDFYDALYEHNTSHPDGKLWLIQGVWATAPPEFNYMDPEYMAEVDLNIRHAVDLVHGNAEFEDRPGWTGGRYRADVSPWLLSWLLGREWEPDDIQGFHELRPDLTNYQGEFISCPTGQPIECWFAQICDYAVAYEDQHYNVQHPVTFSSWPPTDPLSHVSESNIEDEGDVADYLAEGRVDVFSNDAVNITSNSLIPQQQYKAGVYACYHVYPYWPDFLGNEPKYATATDRYGPSNYFGYLQDLKAFYQGRPLLIAEYGVPGGPLPCHLQPQGWNHGGLSEAEVAEALPILTYDIFDSGCAGGVIFSWMDEWFKKVWLWAEFYDPWMDRRLWYNFYDPEENYGLLANHPGADGPNCTLSGNSEEWLNATTLPGLSAATTEGAPAVRSVKVMHDEGFLHVRIELDQFDDWEFAEHGLHLGIDVLGDQRGNSYWPGPLTLSSDRGLEEIVSLTGGEARLWQTESFRFWEPYRMANVITPRMAEVVPHILEEEANRWIWFEPAVEVNRRRVGRDGTVYENKIWSLNPLPRGRLNPGPAYNDLAVWNVTPEAGVVEIRMPWILLGFVGPHQMRVIQAKEDGSNGSEVSEGVGLAVVMASATGQVLSAWPGLDGETVTTSASGRYAWEEWEAEDIVYHSRLKPAYFSMQQLFAQLDRDLPGSP